MNRWDRFSRGILRENPVLVLLLGTCPTLAISTMAQNALGMGLAATAVLIGSNAAISLLRRAIPDEVRIPAYIVVIAGFVGIAQMVMKAWAPQLDAALGVYLPLIVVNCIILGRAEMFASKNGVLDSMLDGAGMGAGFTLALLAMGSIRELAGMGTWFGIRLLGEGATLPIVSMAPGGFFVFGLLIALANAVTRRRGAAAQGCAGCSRQAGCTGEGGDMR